MSIIHRALLRAGMIVAGLGLLAAPGHGQSLSGNGSAGTAASTPTGTVGTAASGPNASLPMFDAVTGKGLLTAGTPLPAGTNALGAVGITTLPALPAGTNSIGTVVTQAAGVTTIQAGGTTSATVGTFVSALVASGTRKGCLVQNTSGSVMYVYLGLTASATIASSLQISAGGSFGCTSPGGTVVQDNIAVASASASASYVVAAQ